MKAVTWQKDSHGLFDYETKSLSVKKYRVDAACKIYRNGIIFIWLGRARNNPGGEQIPNQGGSQLEVPNSSYTSLN